MQSVFYFHMTHFKRKLVGKVSSCVILRFPKEVCGARSHLWNPPITGLATAALPALKQLLKLCIVTIFHGASRAFSRSKL